MKIQIINGPNLNLLGVREPGIYGSNSFESYLPKLKAKFPDIEIEYFQSTKHGNGCRSFANSANAQTAMMKWVCSPAYCSVRTAAA